MENNFDKYFKEKLDNREFEMKPEFWEAAENLIESDERGRLWRGGWMWFGMVLLIGVVAYFGWKNYSQKNQISKDEIENSISENVLLPNTESKATTLNSTIRNADSDKTEINLSENKSVENQKTEIENDHSSISKTKLDGDRKVKEISTKKTNQKINQNDFSSNLPPNDSENAASGFSNNSSNAVEVISKKEEEEESISIRENKLKSENASNSERKTLEDKSKTQPTALLPIAISGLRWFLENDLKMEVKTNVLCYPFDYGKEGTYAWGATAGAVGYPLIENNSTQPFIGFKAGLFGTYYFKKLQNWSIGAEILYHYRSGNFVAIKQFESVAYSFGRAITEEKMTPKSLHYLELPIFLKYHFKKSHLEFGGSMNYLIGVRGEVVKTNETLTGLIPQDGFKKYHANILLGYHYQVTADLRFGIRANFTPGGILDKKLDIVNGEALRESGPLYLTFRVSQNF